MTAQSYTGKSNGSESAYPPNTIPFDAMAPVEITDALNADFPFSMGEMDIHFKLSRRLSADYFSMVPEIRQRAREFSNKVIRPVAFDLDKRISREPLYFAWDVMRAACPYRFFSMLIPPQFEGMGCKSLHMAAMVEELAVGCGGLASTIGVHSAGISCGLVSMNPYLLENFIRPVAKAEKAGEPTLWAGAVTEPQAGTDIWDEDFLEKAKVVTHAKKVSDGYVINGRKCFISNGNVAKVAALAAALDLTNVRESWSAFLVPTDAKGFSIGRVEHKMGQKSSPAAELILEDVFVPKDHLIGFEGMGGRYVSIYLAGSRGPVGAIGTGIARRALECLVDWAKTKKTRRGRLIDQQALQLAVARMAKRIVEARQTYMAAAVATDAFFDEILGHPLVKASIEFVPPSIFTNSMVRKIMQSGTIKGILNGILNNIVTEDRLAAASALATVAKCKGSEVGVDVSGEVARIMGPDCADPRWPVEKCWRDAKLTQIYEGTNQANTITLFKSMAQTWAGR